MNRIDVSDIKLQATDGLMLDASLYEPAAADSRGPTVLITSAVGVTRSFYDEFARFLAEHGLTILTFDYRGVGGSRTEPLKKVVASLDDWATKDIAGAIDWIVETRKPQALAVVAHSLGGQLMGLVPNNDKVTAILAVAAQSGYWGLWSGTRKFFMWSLWHVLMPGLTAALSYFPSKRLGFGEDLPAGVAKQWAYWGRHRDYVVDEQGLPIRRDFIAFRGAMRFYSFSDDSDAPRAAVETLARWYENATSELYHLEPADLKVDKIGHFGFFRERFRSSLWAESAEWLLETGKCETIQSVSH